MAKNKQEKAPRKNGNWLTRLFGGEKAIVTPEKDEQPLLQVEETLLEDIPEPVQEEKEPGIVMAKGHFLYELYCIKNGLKLPEEGQEIALSMFIEGEAIPTAEELTWLESLAKVAERYLVLAKSVQEEPVDSYVHVEVSKDKMSVGLFVFPPLYGGKEITLEQLELALQSAQVVYGIKQDTLAIITNEKSYFTFYSVAKGTAAIDGLDGKIIDHYNRENEIKLKVKEDNTIDYRDLNWLQVVTKGDIICDILPPEFAVAGSDVLGREIKGKDGRKAVVPEGGGTKLNPEETALVAMEDGVLSFVAGKFKIDPLVVIEGDVNTSIGNIDILGDILIKGDIKEGFVVKASGNITVQGMVEDAFVSAGGDIQVGRGMNGNTSGSMNAGKDIHCKFIENANIAASGKVVCDTIINSEISSDDSIQVTTGRGAIIGGNLLALNRIDAKTIGNSSNRNIAITLGNTAGYLKEKQELEDKKKVLTQEIEELEKNIAYLFSIGNEKQADELKLRLSVQKIQHASAERQLQTIIQQEQNYEGCRLRAEVFYPPAQIYISTFSKVVHKPHYNVMVYLKSGEIRVANI